MQVVVIHMSRRWRCKGFLSGRVCKKSNKCCVHSSFGMQKARRSHPSHPAGCHDSVKPLSEYKCQIGRGRQPSRSVLKMRVWLGYKSLGCMIGWSLSPCADGSRTCLGSAAAVILATYSICCKCSTASQTSSSPVSCGSARIKPF